VARWRNRSTTRCRWSIEDDFWGDPPADATRLIETVYLLRHKPVGLLDAEDLQTLVSQKEGLDVLVSRTLIRLEAEPLLEGFYYPGDLLVAVLGVPREYWSAHPVQLAKLERILASIKDPEPDLMAGIEAFQRKVRSTS
jgi:hypothetical protein